MVFSRNVTVEDETNILRLAQVEDAEAQEEILRMFAVFIRACVRKFFLSEADREDLRQEGRIALFRAIRSYRPHRGPFAPFARLVIRRHINRMAEKIIQVRSVENIRDVADVAGEVLPAAGTHDLETAALDEERRNEISSRVRSNLTDLEWEVLSLFLDGLSYREMARRLKRPTKSVDNALRRIRAKVGV